MNPGAGYNVQTPPGRVKICTKTCILMNKQRILCIKLNFYAKKCIQFLKKLYNSEQNKKT